MSDNLKLWFFRDLNDDQRLKLFGLFGLPVDEIGPNHGRQSIALRHITQKLVEMVRDEASPSPETNLIETLYRALVDLESAMHRYEIDVDPEAPVPAEHYRMMERVRKAIEDAEAASPAPQTNMRTVAELPMTAFADAAPQRDEFNGEQTILTYNDKVGIWDLAFFESGEEFPEKWFGDTHWIDITGMWPGVIAQVASFATTEGQP